MLNRLFGRREGELREAVIKAHLLAVVAPFGLEPAHLTADLDRQPVHILKVQFADATTPFAHGFERLGHVVAQGIHGAHTGDDNAVHQTFCSAISASIPVMMDCTFEMSKSP